MKRLRLPSAIVVFATLFSSGCATRPTHLYDADEVYRLEKPMKAAVVFWNGDAWQKAGKVELPQGTYLMGRVDEQ